MLVVSRPGHEPSVQRSDDFWSDLLKQVDRYRDYANADVAEAYVDAVQATLEKLANTPGIGRPRLEVARISRNTFFQGK